MPARALTDAEVRGLKASPGQRLVLYDAKARGLCLRVTARTKSWSFIYRLEGSPRQRRYTIGDYPAWSLSSAREKALGLRHAVQDGRDPVADRKQRREALTVAAMIDKFIAKARGNLRSWQAYEGLLRRDVIRSIGDRPAGEVTRAEIANMLDSILARAPTVANGVHSALSSVYGWAVSEGLVTDNPVRGLRRRHAARSRDRVLSDDELQRFWLATADTQANSNTREGPSAIAGARASRLLLDPIAWGTQSHSFCRAAGSS